MTLISINLKDITCNNLLPNRFNIFGYLFIYVNILIMQEIYKTGGRKFMFLNLPPMACAPGIRIMDTTGKGDCQPELSSYIRLHNDAIFQVLRGLTKQLPGFKYGLYDFYTSTLQRVNYPSKYGIPLLSRLN